MGKIVSFHSIAGGTWRSKSVANMACVLQRMGRKVLVMDFDLRNPNQHQIFAHRIDHIIHMEYMYEGESRRTGTVNLLRYYLDIMNRPSTAEIQYLPTRSVKTMSNGVSLVQCLNRNEYDEAEKTEAEFARYGDSGDLEGLAAEIKKDYDYILVDTAAGDTPFNRMILWHFADSVVLLVNQSQSNLDRGLAMLDRAIEQRGPQRPLEMFPLIVHDPKYWALEERRAWSKGGTTVSSEGSLLVQLGYEPRLQWWYERRYVKTLDASSFHPVNYEARDAYFSLLSTEEDHYDHLLPNFAYCILAKRLEGLPAKDGYLDTLNRAT